MADRRKWFLQLVGGSLVQSTSRTYWQAWKDFLESVALKRSFQDAWLRCDDVVHFIMDMTDKGWLSVTVVGKLPGIVFVSKLLWSYSPAARELWKRLLEGWARERGNGGHKRKPLVWSTMHRVMWAFHKVCPSEQEAALFLLLMSWMFFRTFRVSELLRGKGGGA